MKSLNNSVKNFLIFLFAIGLAASLYLMYALPDMMERSSALVSPDIVTELESTMVTYNLVIIATLAVALIVIIITARRSNKTEIVEKVVYVDKSKDETENTAEQKDQKEIDQTIKEIEEKIKSKRNLQTKGDELMKELCSKLDASQGILYQTEAEKNKRYLKMIASYAFSLPESESLRYEYGEGLAGQAAKEGKSMKVDDIPEGYITVISGLGSASPNHLIIKPIIINDKVEALVELASFKAFNASDEAIIDKGIALLEKEFSQGEDKKEEKKSKKNDSSEKGK